MNQQELIDYFLHTDKEGLEIMQKKNSDYADPNLDVFKNFRVSEVVGISSAQAILVRLMDKICRISNIIKANGQSQVSNETIRDTIVDARNYLAILGALVESELISKWNNLKKDSDGKSIYKN